MSTGGLEDDRVSTTGPGWGPLHAGERHAPRVTDTLTSAVQDGAWRGLKQHVAREDQTVQPRVGKPRQTSRGFRHRGKEETADRDCSQVYKGCHGCVIFTARNFKCEELVETCQSRPPVLANYFDIGVKALMMMMSWCLMSSDVSWHIRDKLWPMPKHGAINLYVHGNQKAR